ncbi:MAG: Beta-N-acetylhexosaminidase [Patescibacteria group bacterium]|nr:Beta-N-acetylhexosaminidase [Patescibacteria group bacterium]
MKKYPRLHQLASKRKETAVEKNFPSPWSPLAKYLGEGKEYGDYYTQEELKKLNLYAKEKGITIVPEIDMPGHATAILFAYPEYSAGEAPKGVATYWGVFSNVIANNEKSINFLKDIFDEIIDIFDGEYVHIGGDEVPLKNYNGNIEHYKNILKEITNYLKSKNKKVIMWNEAFDVDLYTDSIIMAWQNWELGKRFIEKGGRVIFCPASNFYFDYYQYKNKNEPLAIGGYLPIEKVYNFNLEKKLGKEFFYENKENILGIQANLWTEYLNSEEKVDFMLFPRFYALAEVVNRRNNNFLAFQNSLKKRNLIHRFEVNQKYGKFSTKHLYSREIFSIRLYLF